MQKVSTFLMFQGQAEEAVAFYLSLFEGAQLVERFQGPTTRVAFNLAGQSFTAFDSPAPHDFGFTPAISIFVTCGSESEIDRLYAGLSEGGQVMMPLGAYPFSPKFGWLSDRFGVSWQLSL